MAANHLHPYPPHEDDYYFPYKNCQRCGQEFFNSNCSCQRSGGLLPLIRGMTEEEMKCLVERYRVERIQSRVSKVMSNHGLLQANEQDLMLKRYDCLLMEMKFCKEAREYYLCLFATNNDDHSKCVGKIFLDSIEKFGTWITASVLITKKCRCDLNHMQCGWYHNSLSDNIWINPLKLGECRRYWDIALSKSLFLNR